MASITQFAKCPPFPEDVPKARLSKISLARLLANDDVESKALFECCCTLRFFLLDLSGDRLGEALVQDIDAMLNVTEEVMALPEEEKMQYHAKPPERLAGYKSLGYMKTETNQPDRCEFFMLFQDELKEPQNNPEYPYPISENLSLFKSYLAHAQPIVELICRHLSVNFELPASTLYEKQNPDLDSGTMIRLIKYPAVTSSDDRRTSLLPHTDMGTITLLANVLGGLQILAPASSGDGAEEWVHVKPEPNCLIVNIRDAMVQWAGDVLRSNIHRVSYPPGEQENHHRYSIAYLVRAAGTANMRRLKGGLIPTSDDSNELDEGNMTASEWEKKKNMALIQGKDCVRSTGGKPMKRALVTP